MSHSTQPVFGAHGNTRNVVGSGTIRKSAPPSISARPKPPPGVKTWNTLRCEVSLTRSVVVMVQPLRMMRPASAAITCLPRRMPCWSGNESRPTSRPCSSISRSALRAASNCSSLHRPWRSTKLPAADRSCDVDIASCPCLLEDLLIPAGRATLQGASSYTGRSKAMNGPLTLRALTVMAAGLSLALFCVPDPALAQSRPEFINFQGRTKAALYRPDVGPAPHVGILVMHRTSNYLAHRACGELSRRGFLMLCMNTRYENNEAAVDFEKLPLDVKAGVEFLRRQNGISKVVLFAHSGGGPLMALYQAVAEKGPSYCKGPEKLTECGDDLAGLPRADGIVFADAHPGNSINTLRGLNPAVANENHQDR